MSLITQCPACSTMFRVVPDQLRISEGWVRCGQCEEVFDANAQLRSLEQPEPVSAPRAADVLDWGPVAVPDRPLEQIPEPPTAPVFSVPPMEDLDSAPVLDGQREDNSAQESLPEWDAFLGSNPHEQPTLPAATASQPELAPIESSPVAPEHASLSFMAEEPEPTAGHNRLAHAVLVLLCASMLVLLCLQVMVRERDGLAAAVPALRPGLAALCVPLACSISAPRQIEDIVIESSSFTSLKPGVYLLQAVLKNSAALELATPALELTLTDRQDQALLRRVVLAGEWGGKAQISTSSELALKLPISVQADALVTKIAGYKLLAFYP